MPSYVVVGASRGIGYSMAAALSADQNNTVIGLVRSVAKVKATFAEAFPDRQNIHILYGDVDDRQSIEDAATATAAITGGALDVLLVNAAVSFFNFQSIDNECRNNPVFFEQEMQRSFRTNTLGAIYAMTYFAPLLEKGTVKKCAVISSSMADAGFVNQAGITSQSPYAISKAAVNMAVAKFSVAYHDRGILFTAISPGIVATNMGKKESQEAGVPAAELQAALSTFKSRVQKLQPSWDGKPLTPDASAAMVLATLDKATLVSAGGIMISHHGNQTEWV